MKKITVLLIILALMLATLASCGTTPEGTTAPSGTTATTGSDASASDGTTTATEPISDPAESADNEIINSFVDTVRKNTGATAEEIANALIGVKYLKNCEAFKAEYYYPAFDFNFTPAAKDAYYIADNYSTKSNIVYVFELENGADADTFIKSLRDNAEMNWQYNDTPADKVAHASLDNFVLFMLYNDTLSEVDDAPIAKKPRDAVGIFRDYLGAHPTATALEIAEYLASHLSLLKYRKDYLSGVGNALTVLSEISPAFGKFVHCANGACAGRCAYRFCGNSR